MLVFRESKNEHEMEQKNRYCIFIEKTEKRRVKMSENADEQAFPGSAASDEQALPGSAAGRVLVPAPQAASGRSSG